MRVILYSAEKGGWEWMFNYYQFVVDINNIVCPQTLVVIMYKLLLLSRGGLSLYRSDPVQVRMDARICSLGMKVMTCSSSPTCSNFCTQPSPFLAARRLRMLTMKAGTVGSVRAPSSWPQLVSVQVSSFIKMKQKNDKYTFISRHRCHSGDNEAFPRRWEAKSGFILSFCNETSSAGLSAHFLFLDKLPP